MDASDFYYPDELTDVNDILNATLTEHTIDKKRQVLGNLIATEKTAVSSAEDDAQFVAFIDQQRSENTKSKTKCDVNIFKTFILNLNETRELEQIPVKELDKLLCKFFMTIKRKDGNNYEPDTLTSIQRSIQRYLQQQNADFNIIKDNDFHLSREVLAARRKSLVSDGKGNRPNATRPLTDSEEDKLFSVGYFGESDPLVLQRTLWWLLSLQFGFRARDESQKLRWGDVELTADPDTNNEMLVWLAERGSKTRTGKENVHQRAFNPTIQSISGSDSYRCPVRLYKKFRSHRPAEMNQPDSPFYLAINYQRSEESTVWYKKAPLGKNQIGKFLSKAVECGHLAGNKKVTNHSVRKTSISRLLDANCPETFVAQLSGHKSLNSLSHYKTPSMKHQREMSKILSKTNDSAEASGQLIPASSAVTALPTAAAASAFPEQLQIRRQASEIRQTEDRMAYNPNEIFHGASIGSISGCSFNFYTHPPQLASSSTCLSVESVQPAAPAPAKRRRAYILDSDSD